MLKCYFTSTSVRRTTKIIKDFMFLLSLKGHWTDDKRDATYPETCKLQTCAESNADSTNLAWQKHSCFYLQIDVALLLGQLLWPHWTLLKWRTGVWALRQNNDVTPGPTLSPETGTRRETAGLRHCSKHPVETRTESTFTCTSNFQPL